MRFIKVTFDDGDYLTTSINGTDQEILDYYIGNKFTLPDEVSFHTAIKVEFIS